MRILDVLKEAEKITPSIKFKQLGDGSWTVRIEYDAEHVYVHTNKKRDELDKLVKDRYGPKTFS